MCLTAGGFTHTPVAAASGSMFKSDKQTASCQMEAVRQLGSHPISSRPLVTNTPCAPLYIPGSACPSGGFHWVTRREPSRHTSTLLSFPLLTRKRHAWKKNSKKNCYTEACKMPTQKCFEARNQRKMCIHSWNPKVYKNGSAGHSPTWFFFWESDGKFSSHCCNKALYTVCRWDYIQLIQQTQKARLCWWRK